MNLVISKKLIFFFLFINFIQPSNSVEFHKVNKKENNQPTQLKFTKISNKRPLENSKGLAAQEGFKKIYVKENYFKQNSEYLLADLSDDKEELIIQADKQSEKNNIIFAEGNVSVSYKGKFLRADNIIFDKSNKKFNAEGNVVFIMGDQIFKISQLEYNFVTKKGFLLDVEGFLNTNSLIDDLISNFSFSDINNIENFLQFKKNEVLNTPGSVESWLFSTDKITIDGKIWKSKKALFSNDLLESKQVKLLINKLKVISEEEKLKFKSSLNYLIFEEKVSIPFWLGNKTLTKSKSEEFFNFENRWNFGYDNLDKDGYFVGRKFNTINISNDFLLNLEPQFLIQRAFKGYTKSFVKKDESITSERVKRDANFEDYFALNSQIKGPIKNWDLEVQKNLNSLDFDKFPDSFRLKTKLSKDIKFLDSKWNKSFYGIFREKVWNGSLGEAEIYSGYGSTLQKENTWFVNGIKKTEILSLGFANLTAEALNTTDLIRNLRGNLFYSLDQKFPISVKNPENKSIDVSYKYIPEPITKGLSFNTRLEALYSFYENRDHQEYLGIGMGPELILGNFKNKTLDYTRISLFPFYKFDSGKSVFKFDQNYETFTLNIAFDQQLYGPIILKSIGTLNLTDDSNNYGKFIDSKISLNWQKRSYEFGIFYQPHNQSGGISFKLFGFK